MPSARDPEAIYRVFGRSLREIRENKAMAQEELATLSGLTRSSIANIENGRQRVLLHQLVQFAEALGVEVHSLIPLSEMSPLKQADAEAKDSKVAYLEKLRNLAHTSIEQETNTGDGSKPGSSS